LSFKVSLSGIRFSTSIPTDCAGQRLHRLPESRAWSSKPIHAMLLIKPDHIPGRSATKTLYTIFVSLMLKRPAFST